MSYTDEIKIYALRKAMGLYPDTRNQDTEEAQNESLASMSEIDIQKYISSNIPDDYIQMHLLDYDLDAPSTTDESKEPEFFSKIQDAIPNHTVIPVPEGISIRAYYFNNKLKYILLQDGDKNVTKYFKNLVPKTVDKSIVAISFRVSLPKTENNGDINPLFDSLDELIDIYEDKVVLSPVEIHTIEPKANFMDKAKLAGVKVNTDIDANKMVLKTDKGEVNLEFFSLYMNSDDVGVNVNYPAINYWYEYKDFREATVNDIIVSDIEGDECFKKIDGFKLKEPVKFYEDREPITMVYGDVFSGIGKNSKVRITDNEDGTGNIVKLISEQVAEEKLPLPACPKCGKTMKGSSDGRLYCANGECSLYSLDESKLDTSKDIPYEILWEQMKVHLNKQAVEDCTDRYLTSDEGSVDELISYFGKRKKSHDKDILWCYYDNLLKIATKLPKLNVEQPPVEQEQTNEVK